MAKIRPDVVDRDKPRNLDLFYGLEMTIPFLDNLLLEHDGLTHVLLLAVILDLLRR